MHKQGLLSALCEESDVLPLSACVSSGCKVNWQLWSACRCESVCCVHVCFSPVIDCDLSTGVACLLYNACWDTQAEQDKRFIKWMEGLTMDTRASTSKKKGVWRQRSHAREERISCSKWEMHTLGDKRSSHLIYLIIIIIIIIFIKLIKFTKYCLKLNKTKHVIEAIIDRELYQECYTGMQIKLKP